MTNEFENNENLENSEKPAKKCVFLKILAIFLYFFALAAVIIGVVSVIYKAVEAVEIYRDMLPPINDGELNLESMFTGFGFIIVGICLFVVASIFMAIYRRKNRPSKEEDESEDFFDIVTKSITEQLKSATEKLEDNSAKKEQPKKHIYCAYCGSELDETDKKCPSCGSSKKFRK